jgi:hypothetical protein
MKKSHLPWTALLTLATLPLGMGGAIANDGTYMGRAATGESIYFQGATFQCGDLPADNECWWRTPTVSYVIGADAVTAIADCQAGLFQEVWVGDQIVAYDMRPQSAAMQLVLDNACSGAQ